MQPKIAPFKIFLSILFSVSFHVLLAQPTPLEVSGEISENVTWSDDTIKVMGDVTVLDDVTLTIKPGTYVEFQGHFSLFIKGTLLAIGTETDTIKFTVHDTTDFHIIESEAGGWNRIIFNNTPYLGGADGAMNDNDTSVIDHCLLEYSKFMHYGKGLIDGGAINVNEFSRLKIINSTFRNNSSVLWGGAISLVRDANALIQNNTIVHNVGMCGGGIAAGVANPVILDNYIAYNKTYPYGVEYGGGIYCMTCRPDIRRNTVVYNTSVNGAGVMCDNSDAYLADNTIAFNTGDGPESRGGGIYLANQSRPYVVNNLVANNSAVFGGGIYFMDAEPIIANNLVVNNYAESQGAGLYFTGADADVVNNTIFNNHCDNQGGGIIISESSPVFTNCLIWGNTALEGNQLYLFDLVSIPDFYYCNIDGDKNDFGGREFLGKYENNISVIPGLEDPTTGSGLSFDGTDAEFSLKQNSLCINAGNPDMSDYWLPMEDFSGSSRINHSIIDIGAYEAYIPSIQFSDTITNDTTWIADTVYILGDVYVLDGTTLTITPGTVVDFTGYYMINVQGVLNATGTEKNIIQFTIDDTTGLADINTTLGGWNGIKFDNGGEGADGEMWDNDTSKLIYCIIEFGKAKDISPNSNGGAIHVTLFNKLFIEHCQINCNIAGNSGGAIYIYRSDPLIKQNEFHHNYCYADGGAISCEYSDPLIKNNHFHYNRSNGRGGAISNIYSDPVIMNNSFDHNFTRGDGGGIYCTYSSPMIISNYLLNNSGQRGGGIAVYRQYTEITNNIIANNEGIEKGGGIFYYLVEEALLLNNTIANNFSSGPGGGLAIQWSSPDCYNNILWGNEDSWGTQVIIFSHLEKPSFINCNIQGGISNILIASGGEFEGDYFNNIDTLPSFIQPSDGAGTSFDASLADWRLLTVSPCINSGMTTVDGFNLPETDIAFNERIFWEEIDMGAFENQYGKPVITLQPVNQIVCSGDSVSLNIETEHISLIQWQKDGQDMPGADQNKLLFDPVTGDNDGNYQAVVSNSFGSVLSTPVYMIARSAPEIIMYPENSWLVAGEKNALIIEGTGTPPISYAWYKNGTLIPGEKSPELNFSDPDETDEGEYTARISNTCGAVWTDPVSVYMAPQICMVTVDTAEGENKNMVIWEKSTSAPLISYNIYRESYIMGDYSLIGSVPYADLSIFLDTAADPRTQAYWYKITAVDTSGNESPLDACHPHKTIHLLVTINPETGWIQLDWDNYIGFEFYTYNIFSRNFTLSETDFASAHLMASSTSTWSVPSVSDLIYYRVAVERPALCYPTGNQKKDSGPYSHAMSNTEDNRLRTGVSEMKHEDGLSIYPNPLIDRTTLTLPGPEGNLYTLIITDLSGKLCRIVKNISTSEFVLERGNLQPGLYFIELRGKSIFKAKIMVE